MREVDLLVIGGGINGVGVAADAAGRGLRVLLVEKNDLASGTSSASSHLIHGGLRYLEYHEYGLVRKALQEREILLKVASHLVRPLRFILPHEPHFRPRWLIRFGLFIYDHLAKRNRSEHSKAVHLRKTKEGAPLKSHLKYGFSYADAFVDDARLVVSNALQAQAHGASIETRVRCESVSAHDEGWRVVLRALETNQTEEVFARAVVNAAGPWINHVLHDVLPYPGHHRARLIKGSHVVVARLYEGEHAYILQSPDQRIIFTIPYLDDFTLIGTTDVDFQGDLSAVKASPEEIEYLLDLTSQYFKKTLHPEDVLWAYAGVRALVDDHQHSGSAVTRDYHIENASKGASPLINVFGGKITTYRQLSEDVLEQLLSSFPEARPAWTAEAYLPGADWGEGGMHAFEQRLEAGYPWLPDALRRRYLRSYGVRALHFLEGVGCLDDLGTCFGGSVYAKEVDYLVAHEWVRCAEDALWRRSKCALLMTKDEIASVDQYIKSLIEK